MESSKIAETEEVLFLKTLKLRDSFKKKVGFFYMSWVY